MRTLLAALAATVLLASPALALDFATGTDLTHTITAGSETGLSTAAMFRLGPWLIEANFEAQEGPQDNGGLAFGRAFRLGYGLDTYAAVGVSNRFQIDSVDDFGPTLEGGWLLGVGKKTDEMWCRAGLRAVWFRDKGFDLAYRIGWVKGWSR